MPTVLRAKCVVVGDSTVGKSAFIQVFHSDHSQFPKIYSMTVGVELCTKTITIPDSHTCVELFIYDSAGKEVFADVAQKHLETPDMIVVVYDVTSDTSFASCSRWLQRVRPAKTDMKIPGVLVANKTDLDLRRVVSEQQGKEFASSHGLKYFECSVKDQQNVEQPFQFLANEYFELYKNRIEMFKSLANN